jgi:hypothetical protein
MSEALMPMRSGTVKYTAGEIGWLKVIDESCRRPTRWWHTRITSR